MFFDFEQHKHLYMIQKENMGLLIFEVWNKNIFSFVAKLLFAPIKADEKASSYTGVWY